MFLPLILPLIINSHRYEQCGNCVYYKEDPEEFGEEGECTCEDALGFGDVVGYDDESCFDYEEKDDIDEF